jgi:hypothetical protein
MQKSIPFTKLDSLVIFTLFLRKSPWLAQCPMCLMGCGDTSVRLHGASGLPVLLLASSTPLIYRSSGFITTSNTSCMCAGNRLSDSIHAKRTFPDVMSALALPSNSQPD